MEKISEIIIMALIFIAIMLICSVIDRFLRKRK